MTPELYKSVPSEWSDFLPLYDEAVATAPHGAILIECGSFWGKSALYLAEAARLANKGLKVYCIDLWAAAPHNNPGMFDLAHDGGGHIEPVVHGQHHQSLFETFAYHVEQSRNLATGESLSPDPLRIMRMDSLEAAKMFEGLTTLYQEAYVHFVFLDDDHEYEHVKRELHAWEPIVGMMANGERRKGSLIAGHDFTEEFSGVIKATTEYFAPGTVQVECERSWVVRF